MSSDRDYPNFGNLRELLLAHLSSEQFNVLLYLHLYIQHLLSNSRMFVFFVLMMFYLFILFSFFLC